MKRLHPDRRRRSPTSQRHTGNPWGHHRSKIYGRLDCPSAQRAIAAGGYVGHRVFFADAQTAVSAGYRPCAVCLPAAYRERKTSQGDEV